MWRVGTGPGDPLFAVGARVQLGPMQFDALITAVCLRQTDVTYQVVYWQDERRFEEWVHAAEVEGDDDQPVLFLG
jgi:hypothetical protein